MKNKETLEEVAEKYATNHGMMAYVFPEKKESFIQGAKWMQEQQDKKMYSEEEVVGLLYRRSIYQDHFESDSEIRLWFEKFKKK